MFKIFFLKPIVNTVGPCPNELLTIPFREFTVHKCYPYYQFWRSQILGYFKDPRYPKCPLLYMYGTKKNCMFQDEQFLKRVSSTPGSKQLSFDAGHWFAKTHGEEVYYSPGRVGHHTMLFTFRELLEGHMPKTFLSLTQIGALDDKYLNLLFVDFFVELLPERVVLRMIDSFLLEGVKILYRYGVALIHGYKAQLKARHYPTAKAFWLSVKADAIAVSTESNSVMLFKTL
eukprot:gene25545-32015_t